MSTNDRLAKLEAENEELRARLAKLEPKQPEAVKPVPPYEWKGPRDWTANASLPPSAMRAMADAVGGGVLAGVVNDRFRSIEPSSIIPKEGPKVEPKARGSGWQDERPLEGPPGVKIIDQMMDVQDALDKRDLAKRLGQKP